MGLDNAKGIEKAFSTLLDRKRRLESNIEIFELMVEDIDDPFKRLLRLQQLQEYVARLEETQYALEQLATLRRAL